MHHRTGTSATTDLSCPVDRSCASSEGRLLDDAALRLLGDPLRARIVELLAVEALCTCHLVELTGARQTNLSNHLRLLREAGLVTTQPCGRFTYYSLAPEPFRRLAAQLARLAPDGRQDLPRRPCP